MTQPRPVLVGRSIHGEIHLKREFAPNGEESAGTSMMLSLSRTRQPVLLFKGIHRLRCAHTILDWRAVNGRYAVLRIIAPAPQLCRAGTGLTAMRVGTFGHPPEERVQK